MEGYLRLGLMVAIGIIVVLVWWQYKLKRRMERADDFMPLRESNFLEQEQKRLHEELEQQAQPAPKKNNNLLTISVFAKSTTRFASYDLIQAIASTGMQFGEMNIFHYYHRDPQGRKTTLFNLASATKPGEFDLDRMGNFSCVGLTLFMNIKQLDNPLQAFYLMMSTAEQLADDLDGDLRVDFKTPWSDEYFQQYQQKILDLVGSHREAVT